MRKRLHEQGLLASTDQTRDRLTVRRTLQGKRRDVLHLHPDKLTADSPEHASQPRHPPTRPATPAAQKSPVGQMGRLGRSMTQNHPTERERGGAPPPGTDAPAP